MHWTAAKMYESSRTNSMTDGTDQRQMPYVDLFAGPGGFRLTLKTLGHKCVSASEIDET